MPWNYQPPKLEPDLQCFAELPEGYTISKLGLFYSKAVKVVDLPEIKHLPFSMFECRGDTIQSLPGCGWVAADPIEEPINTIRPLSGRRGTDYICPRCGAKIAFSGCYS